MPGRAGATKMGLDFEAGRGSASMRDLAVFVALGWFWLTFYGVGPLTSWTELAVGGASLAAACLAAAALGAATARRRRPVTPARADGASAAPRR